MSTLHEIINDLKKATVYIVEAKNANGFPPDTDIKDIYGQRFSKWDGKLALVITDETSNLTAGKPWFDPKTMSQRYSVRYAIDMHTKKPIESRDKFLGQRPSIKDGSIPYEHAVFTNKHGTFIEQGTFAKPLDVWIPKKLNRLSKDQSNMLKRYLQDKGYIDVGDQYGHYKKVKTSEWKKALRTKFDNLSSISDDLETSLYYTMKKYEGDDDKWSATWSKIPGIYLLDQKDRVKFFFKK
jgi:hypothetical protein